LNLILGFTLRFKDTYAASIKGDIIREKIFKLITKHSKCYATRKNKLEKEGKTESCAAHTDNFLAVNKGRKYIHIHILWHV